MSLLLLRILLLLVMASNQKCIPMKKKSLNPILVPKQWMRFELGLKKKN